MDNFDEERASGEDGWMWWNFFIAAGAVAFSLRLASDANEWWEFTTIAIMGVLAVVLLTQGVRGVLARRRRARERQEER